MTHTVLTRRELYRLVWSAPMLQVASRFGLSDRGLAKICRRQAVPFPSRGYWQKRRAGQNPEQTPLPVPPAPENSVGIWHGYRFTAPGASVAGERAAGSSTAPPTSPSPTRSDLDPPDDAQYVRAQELKARQEDVANARNWFLAMIVQLWSPGAPLSAFLAAVADELRAHQGPASERANAQAWLAWANRHRNQEAIRVLFETPLVEHADEIFHRYRTAVSGGSLGKVLPWDFRPRDEHDGNRHGESRQSPDKVPTAD